MQGILRPQCSPAATDCQPAAERQPYPKITLDIACRTNRKESLAMQGFSLASHHRAHRNHRRRTPRHARPPDGACATTPPQTTAFAARIASPRTLELPLARLRRARAGFQSAARYSKSMPRPPHRGCKRKRRPNRRLGAASAAKDEPARQARAPRALLLLF